MGRDKALLPWGDTTLAQSIAEIVIQAAGTATLIGDPGRYRQLGIECIPDVRPGQGPLAGIETALSMKRARYNLVVACDTPGVSLNHAKRLLATAQEHEALCVVTTDASGTHPLLAVYHCDALPYVQSALDNGRLRLLDVVAELNPIEIRSTEPILNVNTIEDWKLAR